MNNTNSNQYQEDEIDLKELFHTIMNSKKIIIIITSIITIFATIWAMTTTPIYEAKSILRIGYYTDTIYNKEYGRSSEKRVTLANTSALSEELKILYIDLFKNKKNRTSEITSVSILKKQKEFLTITSNAINNELAEKELNTVIDFIKNEHKKILSSIKINNELNIKRLNSKIKSIINKEIPMLRNNLESFKNDRNMYSIKLKKLAVNISQDKNPALAMLELNEQKQLIEILFKLRNYSIKIEKKIFDLKETVIPDLNKRINDIKIILQPYNYKNTYIVGKIITNNFPIKPKKKLIILVSFIIGFIFSIFLVLFLEFIKKEEES